MTSEYEIDSNKVTLLNYKRRGTIAYFARLTIRGTEIIDRVFAPHSEILDKDKYYRGKKAPVVWDISQLKSGIYESRSAKEGSRFELWYWKVEDGKMVTWADTLDKLLGIEWPPLEGASDRQKDYGSEMRKKVLNLVLRKEPNANLKDLLQLSPTHSKTWIESDQEALVEMILKRLKVRRT